MAETKEADMTRATILPATLGGLFLLIMTTGTAQAAGPRASISVATVCELDGTDLKVELRIRDKTSGDAIPVVTAWNIDASYLERGIPGNDWQTFANDGKSGLQQGVPVTITSTFSLCAAGGGIRSDLAHARALNALVDVTFGKDDGRMLDFPNLRLRLNADESIFI